MCEKLFPEFEEKINELIESRNRKLNVKDNIFAHSSTEKEGDTHYIEFIFLPTSEKLFFDYTHEGSITSCDLFINTDILGSKIVFE